MQFVLFISQQAIELLSQKQGLIRRELEQHPLADLILDLELVGAALAGGGDTGEDFRLQSTGIGLCCSGSQ
jgi:hypothetical protein